VTAALRPVRVGQRRSDDEFHRVTLANPHYDKEPPGYGEETRSEREVADRDA